MPYTVDTKNEDWFNSLPQEEQGKIALDLCTGAAIPLDNKPVTILEDEESYQTLPDIVPAFKLR